MFALRRSSLQSDGPFALRANGMQFRRRKAPVKLHRVFGLAENPPRYAQEFDEDG